MSILNEIYEYKINFVNMQKKIHAQSDILKKIKNIPSHDFSFSKKLKNETSRTSIIGELKRASPSLGNFVNEEINLSNIIYAVDEEVKMLNCKKNSKKGCNNKSTKCITHNLWDELDQHINSFFKRVKLKDLVKDNTN